MSVIGGFGRGLSLEAVGIVLVFGAACASKDADVRATPAPTLLAVQLAAGVQVWVDDVELGVTPLPEKELTSGEHTVRVKTACGEVTRAGFEVLAERTTPLTAADLPGFATAELRVTAQTHLGEAVSDLAVFVDDEQLTTPAAGAPWAVPACRLRVRVAAVGRDDLGGVIEHIEFGADAKIDRAVVVAPGPDMVRIPAGSFVFGPNEAVELAWRDAFESPPTWHDDPRVGAEVQMPPLEIDQSEVTASQYLACRRAAKRLTCFSEADCREAGGCTSLASVAPYSDGDGDNCIVRSRAGVEQHAPNDANRPMNCITVWGAEAYCRWAGKRLPSDVEWEYVARSRRTDFSAPWGFEADPSCLRSVCPTRGSEKVMPENVCSRPTGNTADGVCDMMGNVSEIVALGEVPGRRAPHGRPSHYDRGSSIYMMPDRDFDVFGAGNHYASYADGFRCVRDTTSDAILR